MIEIKDIMRFWLYSGNFSGWWCYDPVYFDKLNKIYADYCKRMNIEDKFTKKHKNISNIKIPIKKLSDEDSCFDMVDFGSESEDDAKSVNYQDDNNADDTTNLMDYNLIIDQSIIKIDFDQMKQLKISDPSKQRKIKYLDIPNKIYGNENEIINFLLHNSIKGIAGKPFDKK